MPYDQRIPITDAVTATWIVIAILLVAVLASIRRSVDREILPPSVSQELKGFGMLAVVFGHIGFFLVDDPGFLWPLSIASGLGVDVFLFLSGYGLTVGMLKKPMRVLDFYQRRLVKVFVPFWIALIGFFVVDYLLLDRTYPAGYVTRSLFGLFPVADMATDVNSVFWYITWIAFYYLLFPIFFMPKRPWLTAILLFLAGTLVVRLHPAWFALVIRLYEVHTLTFPLGVLAAWWLYTGSAGGQAVRVTLQQRRQALPGPHYAFALLALILVFGYLATHSGVNQGAWKEQSANILILFSLVALFSLKRFDIGLLAFFGTYSYEIYLLHWPILSRYDVFFNHVPAWAAVVLYLLTFIGLAWGMSTLTTPISRWLEPVKAARPNMP